MASPPEPIAHEPGTSSPLSELDSAQFLDELAAEQRTTSSATVPRFTDEPTPMSPRIPTSEVLAATRKRIAELEELKKLQDEAAQLEKQLGLGSDKRARRSSIRSASSNDS